MILEERIKDSIKTIEKLFDEIKEISEVNDNLIKDFENKQIDELTLGKNHFANTSYIGILHKEIENRISKLAECATLSDLLKIDLNLSARQREIVDSYISSSKFNFVVDNKGKLVPITSMYDRKELLLKVEALSTDIPILKDYYNTIKIIKNGSN
jgi:F0F1-type ATP synthase gamma subunit